MFLVETNRVKRLLHLSFIGKVSAADLERGGDEVQALLKELPPGFVLLTDLSRLETMEVACGKQIGRTMDWCRQHGVGKIVRVVPDPTKDIGLNILSIFHYEPGMRVITCENLTQAERHLAA